MKILFVASYFPPLNITGSRRVTAFSKFLTLAGHEVVVITKTKNLGPGDPVDERPQGVRVIEVPRDSNIPSLSVPSPTYDGSQDVTAIRLASAAKLSTLLRPIRRLFGKLSLRWFGQLIERDLIFVIQAVRDPRVLREAREADVILSTSPPWVTHLAARYLSSRNRTPWVIDYRDQFSHGNLAQGSRFSRRVEVQIDKWLARKADAVISVSPPIAEYYAGWNNDSTVIYNGYDPDLIEDALKHAQSTPKNRRYVFRYVGTYPRHLPPIELIHAFEAADAAGLDFRVEFVGPNSSDLMDAVSHYAPAVLPRFRGMPQVGSGEALRLIATADCVLIIETWHRRSSSQKGVATTKMFEYLALGKPAISATSPEIAAAQILERADLLIAASTDSSTLADAIVELVQGRIQVKANKGVVDKFSRRAQALELEDLLRRLVGEQLGSVDPR